ncbi:MAG: protein kinase [Planctomycetaceae bacterium]
MSMTCPSCSAALNPETGSDTFTCHSCGRQIRRTSVDETIAPVPPGDSQSVAMDETFVPASGGNPNAAIESTVIGKPEPASRNVIGHFQLQRVLGRGGFGQVWLARDLNLERLVALKLPAANDRHPRLLHEAQTGAKLKHPHIVAVYEVGEVGGQAYIASEFIDGITLRDELQRGRPTIDRAVHVMELVARAAHYAHEQHVVHRDLKPANVMIDASGEPHVADFGIAKSVAADATISLDGEIVGTIAYMAPEQARGKNRQTDRRADVYAMGVMLFELLTEYRPFRGNAEGILVQKGVQDAPSPRTLVPTVSRDLETVCLKCLERDPDRRYQTALEFAQELQRIRTNVPILARPISRPEKVWRWCRRNPVVSGLLAAIVLSLSLGLAGTSYFAIAARKHARETDQALYRARMSLAGDIATEGDTDRLKQLLSIYEHPENSDSDLRDFAWRHFQYLTRPFVRVVQHGARIDQVTMSVDGRAFASLGADYVKVWNSEDGVLLRTLNEDHSPMRCMDFLRNDNRLVTGHADGSLRVWNPTEHGRVAFEFETSSAVQTVRMCPDSEHLASGHQDGVIRIHHLGRRELVHEFPTPDSSAVVQLAWSPDAERLALLTFASSTPSGLELRNLSVLDAETGSIIHQEKRPLPYSDVEFRADSKHLVFSSKNGVLSTISLETHEADAAPRQSTAFGDLERVERDGRELLFVSSISGQVHLLNSSMQAISTTRALQQSFGTMASSAKAGQLVVGSGDGSARLLSLDAMAEPGIVWVPDVVRDLQFVNDGQAVAIAETDGGVRVWDLKSESLTELLPASDRPRPVLALAVNPVTGTLAACGMMRELRMADPTSQTVVQEIQLPPSGHSSLAHSSDGRLLAVGSRAGSLAVYKTGAPAPNSSPDQPAAAISDTPVFEHYVADMNFRALSFAPGQHVLLAISANGQLLQVDVDRQQVRDDFEVLDDRPLSLAFAPDARTFAVGTQGGYIRIYDYPSVELQRELKAHSGPINSLAWFPDGQLLVSAGQDVSINIWETRTFDIVTSLRGHAHQIFKVTVSPDGHTIASSSSDGDIRIWKSR